MPKVKISEYSATANSNTDVASINIDEGCAPSGINNAIRAVMGHLKDFQQGTNGDPFNGPVNGTVGATTPATGAFTTLSASGIITSTVTAGQVVKAESGTTGILYSNFANTGGTFLYGIDNSAGTALFSGSAAYAGFIGTSGARPLVLATNGAGRAFIDSSGNVGIGTSSPSGKLDVLRSSTTTTAFDESVIRAINSGAATLNQRVDIAMRFQDGTYNGTGGISMIRESATARSGALSLSSIDSSGNPTNGIRLNSTGAVALLGASTSATGVGITFPATQSASANANTLDDYEEGTWTPVLGGSTSESGQTYSRQLGKYTKIGRVVTVSWDVIISNVGTVVGEARLKGLPVNVGSSDQGFRAGLALGEFSGLATSVVVFSGLVVEGTAQLYLRVATSANTGVAAIASSSLWATGTQFIGSITYMTD